MQGEPFLVYAPSRTPTIPTVYVRCPRCLYTISLCLYADSRMIGLPRTATLGHEFLNKKLIRGSRRMDAVAAKSDAVTAWSHRFESVGTDLNLWEQIAFCGHRFESVGTDCNLWPLFQNTGG